MNVYVLPLADPSASLETTGGKGMSLAKMLAAGLPVPDGFHVTTSAYRRFVTGNGIQPRILEALQGLDPTSAEALEAVSQRFASFFAAGQIPPEIASAICQSYAELGKPPVAVRSSATAEDLPEASFAGQQETYLNIRGEEALLEAVKKCWASLWTARAIAYRLKNGIDQETVALAVAVQELVSADAAGILFTANPVNGKRDEMLINAAWGLGEAVVSGAVTPDTLTVKKDTGKVLRRETAEKAVMTVRTESGVEEAPVPAELRNRPVLDAAQAAALARLGVKIEVYYQAPMDVEWALAEGEFYILQARPITTLPPEWIMPDPTATYARGSLAEHIPGPVTPLFGTLGLSIANEATRQMWDRIIGSDSTSLMAGDGFYLLMNGYVYGGIKMRGKNLFKVLRMSLQQLGPVFKNSVARWLAARQELAAVVNAWEQKPAERLSPSELLEGVRAVFGAACHYFTEIQTTLPAASTSEVLFTRFYERMIRREGDPEAAVFLRGHDTFVLQAEKSLFDLAGWVREDPALAEYIAQENSAKLVEDFQHNAPPERVSPQVWAAWRDRFNSHLHNFGRTAYEFDFANPTPLETPEPMLDALKAFLSGTAGDPYKRQAETIEKRERAVQAILARVGWPRRAIFKKLLRWTHDTAPMRENSIFDMGMGHPLVRSYFAELGRRLVAGGAIDQPEDLYWLEQAELEKLIAALEAGTPLPDYRGPLPERKRRRQEQLKFNPPVMLPERSGWSRFVHGAEAETRNGKVVLKGVGASGGTVTAPACVLYGPEDFNRLKPGDVLVAVTTTPAWTPLFALASAVVTDIGGPLSHSSIVAREYGIPAVMAARTATRDIQSGQLITVDGSAGTVTLEA